MGAGRIGVLGGTFDPPHIAHLTVGAAAMKALDLDRVVFVPAGHPWRKAGRHVTAADIRVRMLRAALEPLDWAEISTIEVDHPGPSYMADTLPLLAEREPAGTAWWFVLGDDALEDMPHWHQPDRLLKKARLGLVGRPPGPLEVPLEIRSRFPRIEERLDVIPMMPLHVSATDLRARVRDGRPTHVLLPAAVRRIVDELRLYRA